MNYNSETGSIVGSPEPAEPVEDEVRDEVEGDEGRGRFVSLRVHGLEELDRLATSPAQDSTLIISHILGG